MCLETLMKAKAKSAWFQKSLALFFFIYIRLYIYITCHVQGHTGELFWSTWASGVLIRGHDGFDLIINEKIPF